MNKKFLEILRIIFNWTILITVLLTPLIFLWKIDQLETKITQPITYQVDSWGGQVIGVVDDKYQVGESYNLVIDGDYFSVNKEQYQAAEVGDTVIGFLSKGE